MTTGDGRGALRVWERFHVRLTAVYALAVAIVLGVVALWQIRTGREAAVTALRSQLVAVAVSVASSVPQSVVSGRSPAERDLLERQLGDVGLSIADIRSIYVLRPTGHRGAFAFVADWDRRIASQPWDTPYDASEVPVLIEALQGPRSESEPVADAFGVTLSGYAPVRAIGDGPAIAVVGVDVDAGRVDELEQSVMVASSVAFGSAALLLALAALVAGRMLRGPLERVMGATAALSRGQLATRVDLHGRRDEFGILGDHFDAMAAELEEREFLRLTFGRFVSPDVARKLLADKGSLRLGGEEREVTVLFSDLAGYSTVAEKLAPTEVIRMLNDYVGAMNTVIAAHDGCVIEFFGDGILAVFGAPADLPGHAEAGVRCARDMRDALQHLNERWRRDSAGADWLATGDLTARIGVHTGRVVAGNMGCELRMKYAVIGDTVNVAARLEQLNKELGTSVLISSETAAALTESLRSELTPRGRTLVKGRRSEVTLFSA